jgi:hypothetical protein
MVLTAASITLRRIVVLATLGTAMLIVGLMRLTTVHALITTALRHRWALMLRAGAIARPWALLHHVSGTTGTALWRRTLRTHVALWMRTALLVEIRCSIKAWLRTLRAKHSQVTIAGAHATPVTMITTLGKALITSAALVTTVWLSTETSVFSTPLHHGAKAISPVTHWRATTLLEPLLPALGKALRAGATRLRALITLHHAGATTSVWRWSLGMMFAITART